MELLEMLAYISLTNLAAVSYLVARTQINGFMIKHIKAEIVKICKWVDEQKDEQRKQKEVI